MGLPHSEFLSWSDDDQDKALAWIAEQKTVCHNCGTRDEDWRNEKNILHDPPPFEVADRRCAGCLALERFRQQEEVKKDGAGLYVYLRPFQPVPDDEAGP